MQFNKLYMFIHIDNIYYMYWLNAATDTRPKAAPVTKWVKFIETLRKYSTEQGIFYILLLFIVGNMYCDLVRSIVYCLRFDFLSFTPNRCLPSVAFLLGANAGHTVNMCFGVSGYVHFIPYSLYICTYIVYNVYFNQNKPYFFRLYLV